MIKDEGITACHTIGVDVLMRSPVDVSPKLFARVKARIMEVCLDFTSFLLQLSHS